MHTPLAQSFSPPPPSCTRKDSTMNTRWFVAALATVVAVGMSPDLSEAKRLGGGKNSGMQRQAPAQSAPQTPPSQAPATPAAAPTAGKPAVPATAAAAAAAPAKRSWLGPIAGLAAGLGLAALFSSMGLGEELASFMMLLLLGVVAFFAIRFIMARMRGGAAKPAMAAAGAGAGMGAGSFGSQAATATEPPTTLSRQGFEPASAMPSAAPVGAGAAPQELSAMGTPLRPLQIGEALGTVSTTPAPGMKLPEGFDMPAFERVAKMIFIRLQAANDKGDLDDLREFTTPEMFAAVRLDIQERSDTSQHTDVERIEAQLIDFVSEDTRQIASVRFTGLVKEERDAPAVAIDEVWHLV
ncbi:MAG: Tim44 domain-containing protein [Rubrivivax sp.]